MNRAVSSCGRSMRSRKIDTGKGKAKSRMKSHLPLSLKLAIWCRAALRTLRSEEHTSELQSLMRISYAVFCLKKKNEIKPEHYSTTPEQTKTPNPTHLTPINHTN